MKTGGSRRKAKSNVEDGRVVERLKAMLKTGGSRRELNLVAQNWFVTTFAMYINQILGEFSTGRRFLLSKMVLDNFAILLNVAYFTNWKIAFTRFLLLIYSTSLLQYQFFHHETTDMVETIQQNFINKIKWKMYFDRDTCSAQQPQIFFFFTRNNPSKQEVPDDKRYKSKTQKKWAELQDSREVGRVIGLKRSGQSYRTQEKWTELQDLREVGRGI